ncbi:hypothetical protein [Hyphomicrobium sp.]|uniref:spermine/spermidine synthase domain-containing protein n=1 Tax=Hyphomicrobium sp. TaxID=82 RepID=UPI002FDFFCBC
MLPLLLAVSVGFWSLAAQFIFNRIIFFYLAHSDFAAACIITIHLSGFLIGTLIAPRIRSSLTGLLSIALLLSCLAALMVWRMSAPVMGLSATIALSILFGVCLATLSGMLLIRLMVEGGKNGQARKIVIADSAGSVLGAALSGFHFVPYVGITASFCALLLMQAAALILAMRLEHRSYSIRAALPFAVAVFVAAFLIAPPATRQADGKPQQEWAARIALEYAAPSYRAENLVFSRTSPYGIVSVARSDAAQIMLLDNKPLCELRDQVLAEHFQFKLGSIPADMIAHNVGAEDARAAVVGLGCGFTLAGILSGLRPDAHAEVIEINPQVAEAQKLFWPLLPHTPEDKRALITIADGFTFFAKRSGQPSYDAVVLDLSWMHDMVATHLFSYEMFRNIHANLKQDGVFTLWISSDNPFAPESLIVYRTLKRVFSFVYVDYAQGAMVYFASEREDIVNYLAPEAGRISGWLLDQPEEGEINTLDTLVLGRFRARAAVAEITARSD